MPEQPLSRKVRMPVTVLVAGTTEQRGMLIRASETHLIVEDVSLLGGIAAPVAVFLDDGSRIAGDARPLDECVVTIHVSPGRLNRGKAARLAGRAPARLGTSPRRRSERVKVDDGRSRLQRADGSTLPCRIADVSLTGLGIECAGRLVVGEVVQVGKIHARVVRSTPTGYGLSVMEGADAARELARSASDLAHGLSPEPARQSLSIFRPFPDRARPER